MTHHRTKGYYAPLWVKLLASVIIGCLLFFILNLFLPTYYNLVFTISFILSFLSYELYHYRVHAVPPKTKLGKELRKHHFHHHFTNPRVNHGVTTVFWDKVFGTYQKTEIVEVHKNFAMDWLLNNQKKYAEDYIVREHTTFT